MTRLTNSLVACWSCFTASVKTAHRFRLASLAMSLVPLATPAFGQVAVNYYAGTDSAGMSVGVYTFATPQGDKIYGFEFSGNRYCGDVLVPGTTLGGNTDGTEFYLVIDGRATFSELRPDFFISADMRFIGNGKVVGSASFKQAIYTGPSFPPTDRDASSCTTKKLTFTASYVGTLSATAKPFASLNSLKGK